METTESPIVTELSDEQPLKANIWMEVTESGIVTEVSDEQPDNFDFSQSPWMETTPLGIITEDLHANGDARQDSHCPHVTGQRARIKPGLLWQSASH